MAGRATGAGPGHPHHASQRRLVGGHNGGFHLRLSDLQAVANHVLGAEAAFVHGLTTCVASVRLNLSSRQHPSREQVGVNRLARKSPEIRLRVFSAKHLRATANGDQLAHRTQK